MQLMRQPETFLSSSIFVIEFKPSLVEFNTIIHHALETLFSACLFQVLIIRLTTNSKSESAPTACNKTNNKHFMDIELDYFVSKKWQTDLHVQ